MSKNHTIWGNSKNSYKLNKSSTNQTKDSFQADVRIKYCITCKSCWEVVLSYSGFSGNKKVIKYYDDFVSYGKQRETCPRCQLKIKKV